MAPFDAHKNLAISTVATAPSPATSGTSLTVATGEGTRFPAVPFNATICPPGVLADPTNAEIVRVTARAGDVLTLTRTQEGTTARTVLAGDLIVATITAKTLTDVEAAGGSTVIDLPIEQATLPDGTGTINTPPELTREVSTGTQTTNTPKRTRTFAKFDAATDEHLQWGHMLPANYGSGGTIRLKWKAATATSGNVIWKAGFCASTDGSTDDDVVVFAAADLAAASAAPATQGQLVEATIALTMTGAAASRGFTVFLGRDADNGSDTMSGDAILMSARLEYTSG